MGILTEAAIKGYKADTLRKIARARFCVDGVWYEPPIHRREWLKDDRVAVYFSITPNISGDVTISEVQLYDTNNDLWASKQEDITVSGTYEGVLYRFAFDFREVVANV